MYCITVFDVLSAAKLKFYMALCVKLSCLSDEIDADNTINTYCLCIVVDRVFLMHL